MRKFVFLYLGLMLSVMNAHAATVLNLSLDDTSYIALKSNLDIQIAQFDQQIAQTGTQSARSVYDFVLDGTVDYRNDQKQRATVFQGEEINTNNYNVSLSKQLPTGTNVKVETTNNRVASDSAFATSAVTHDSAVGVTVEQSLGKNFFGIQDRGDVKLATLETRIAEFSSLDKIEAELARVQKAYWDVVLQTDRVEIEKVMEGQAKEFYDLQKDKLKDGLAESPDALAAEANYESRLNNVRLAQNALKTKNNVIKIMLDLKEEDSFRPTQQFTINGSEDIDFKGSLQKAFNNRRDYKSLLKEVEKKEIELSMKKNDLWPEMNLTASMTKNGLGDHFKQALEEAVDENHREYFLGLTFNFPLENRKSRAAFSKAKLEQAKTLVELKLLERKIMIDIDDQIRTVNVLRQVAANDQRIADLQRQKLEAEEKRFSRGRSTTDIIIRFQEDLLQARLRASESMYNYHASLVDLGVKEATLLSPYIIEDE